MPPRKVLLITYHFPPSGAVAVYRMLGLVRHLPKYGWQPIVVAPPRLPWEPEDASLLSQVPPETLVECVPFATGFVGKVARYFAPEAHWLYEAHPVCRRMIEQHRPDAIITSSPPGCVHRLGLWLKARFGLPWLACFRDPWITNRASMLPGLLTAFERRQEAKVMARATTLIANTPRNQQGWANAYPHVASKIVVITNGFDPEKFPARGETREIPETLTILHAGELYGGRDPRPLLAALQGPAMPVRVEFLGRATDPAYDLAAEVQRRGLSGLVTQLPQAPYAEAVERMVHADILLLVQTPGERLGVPAKLYEYFGAGRPILALAEPDGDIAWALRESKVLHCIVAPTDVPRIRQAIVELTNAVKAGERAIPDRGALEQFTRERMAQRFADCLDAAASNPKSQ